MNQPLQPEFEWNIWIDLVSDTVLWNDISDFLPVEIWSEYEQDVYIERLKKRFPFFTKETNNQKKEIARLFEQSGKKSFLTSSWKRTKDEIIGLLQWNKDTRDAAYDRNAYPFYEKDLKGATTPEKRKEIIEGKTKKILNKYTDLSWETAYWIAKAQTMKPKKYVAYGTIAAHIFDHMWLKPNRDNTSILPTKQWKDNWYLFFGEWTDRYCIEISDYCANTYHDFVWDGTPVKQLITVDYRNDRYCVMNHEELSYMFTNCSSDEQYAARIKDYMEFNGERWLENFLQTLEYDRV